MPTQKLTNEILTAAIEGFELQKERIEAKIAELRRTLTGSSEEEIAAPEPVKGGKRKMSAAGRKRIAEAQRKRWAAVRGDSAPEAKAEAPAAQKPKRRLSAAGRKKIIEATKKRWAEYRAQNKKAATAKK